MSKDHRLVYSTDAATNQRCPRCKEVVSECICAPAPGETEVKSAVLRLEKKGRGGKTVTVVDKLPANATLLAELATRLKKRCGTGGTSRIEEGRGVIEIQGDKRDEIRALLSSEGVLVKG